MRIAVVGAGIGGLTLARELSPHADVVVFEKARGVGGRMSTRRAGNYAFDHGAPSFTADSEAFKAFLAPFMDDGTVRPWTGPCLVSREGSSSLIESKDRLVAAPQMNSLCKALVASLDVRLSWEVAPLQEGARPPWTLQDKTGAVLGTFDWVISTAPSPQTKRLFAHHLPQDNPFEEHVMTPAFSLMVGLEGRWQHPWTCATFDEAPIHWISVDSTKPGRSQNVTCFVARASLAWSHSHLEDNLDEVKHAMVDHFCHLTGFTPGELTHTDLHRWRYALPDENQPCQTFFCEERNLAALIEGGKNGGVDGSWDCAQNLAKRLMPIIQGARP